MARESKVLDSMALCKEYLEKFQQSLDSSNLKSSDKEYFQTIQYVFNNIPEIILEESGGGLSKSQKGRFHQIIKSYLAEIQKFFSEDSAASPDAIAFGLVGLTKWVPLMVNFPETRKKLVERLVSLWSSHENDQARLNALLVIHKAASAYPKLLDGLLKKMYTSFGKACRTLSLHTMGTATFLLNGLVEIFSIDPSKAAPRAEKCVKQLASLLQASIKQPTKDSLAKVYSWTFIWSVKFLARLVATSKSSEMKSLRGKVFTLIHANLNYNFVPRFYAFHFHLIGAANEICRSTAVYFPSVPFLLQVLRRIVGTATKPETGKPKVYDFTTLCKMPKTEAASRCYLDCAAEEALFLIGESLIGFSHSLAYPELAGPIAAQLRVIEAINKGWKVSKLCGTLAAKLDQHSQSILEIRIQTENCAPSRISSKHRVELTSSKDILDQFHKHTQRVREQRRKLVASSTENKTYNEPDFGDSDVEEIAKSTKKEAAKLKKSSIEKSSKMVAVKGIKRKAATSPDEDDLVDGVRKILAGSKKSRPSQVDDVIEDFDISDF